MRTTPATGPRLRRTGGVMERVPPFAWVVLVLAAWCLFVKLAFAG